MTPAEKRAVQANIALSYLKFSAWGLNRTPHATRLIGDWEREKNRVETMIIPKKKGERL